MQFLYTSLYGYFAESFITTYLAVLMIFAARNIYTTNNPVNGTNLTGYTEIGMFL